MKYLFATIALVTSAVITHHASAQKQTADDVKWINQCVDDNKAEPVQHWPSLKPIAPVHEREDGQQRIAVHLPVGKDSSERARRLQQASRVEVANAGFTEKGRPVGGRFDCALSKKCI